MIAHGCQEECHHNQTPRYPSKISLEVAMLGPVSLLPSPACWSTIDSQAPTARRNDDWRRGPPFRGLGGGDHHAETGGKGRRSCAPFMLLESSSRIGSIFRAWRVCFSLLVVHNSDASYVDYEVAVAEQALYSELGSIFRGWLFAFRLRLTWRATICG
jgi:hypothetical protein